MSNKGGVFQLIEGNWHDGTIIIQDETVDPPVRLDITDLTVEMYLKASAADTDPVPLSTETGEISKTDPKADPANGVARVHFTDVQTSTPTKKPDRFWRVDVLNTAGERRTVMWDNYGVTDV